MENNDLFPAKKQEAEETKFISEEKPPPPVTTKVAKMEYTDWSPLLKEHCERYLAKKKEEDRKYFSEFFLGDKPRAVKTNIADNHTLPFPKPFPNEGLEVESYNEKMKRKLCCYQPSKMSLNFNSIFDLKQLDKKVEVAKMEYTDWSPFSEFLRNKRPAVKTNIADNHTPAVTSGTLFVTSDPFLAERVAKRQKVESLEEEPLETTNPVCNPFPAKKEKESKFVRTKPRVAEKHPVMSDPFLAERPPHMFLNIFFAYQQKVEKLAEMLKIESIEGEPQVTTDPLVAKKHHVSTMFLNLFLAYKQEVERVAKMLKQESVDGEPFLTTDPILAEKPPVLAYQQEVESSKKKEEESNTTNIAEKHTLTYFDDKPVSQPASSSDTAT
ncbi:uncharacterized protein [Medicago truncatula]|uniref:uncharacterized protein isoform X3 n=1 Tax=Medicago truncatula TaxID=3880 RepID=UPI001966E02B|nr:uncharacterized protein LOC112422187 isoform X3 [Medicago truncatula]